MTTSAEELGRIIGGIARQQSNIQENISPDEADALLNVYNTEQLVIEVVMTVTTKCYDANTFVIDHPVYGDIDSATLLIDGGYTACPPGDSGGDGRTGIF